MLAANGRGFYEKVVVITRKASARRRAKQPLEPAAAQISAASATDKTNVRQFWIQRNRLAEAIKQYGWRR